MAQQTINAGSPPIVWSTVEDAFTKINSNFDELYGSIGSPGGILDFTSLSTSIIPSASEVYDLGSPTNRWRDLYLAGSSLYLGSAQITANLAGVVNLPAGATVAGELIRNPSEASFKILAVTGQSNIVADSFEDTLTVAAGNAGITLTTNATTDTLTIANSGVTSLTGTAGQIGVSAATGGVTLTNLGVTSLLGTVGEIGVSAATGGVTLTNLGVKKIIGTASQIGVSGDGTGNVTLTNLAPASPTFRYIVVDGATLQPVSADNISDTLNLISGPGLTIGKDTGTDTLTFSVNSNLDINGSVFSDGSTMLVDGSGGRIVGDVYTSTLRTSETKIALGQGAAGDGLQGLESIAIGMVAGGFTQGDYAVAIGSGAGNIGQGNRAVAIGATAGVDQGDYAISIGNSAGYPSAVASSIAINASGFTLDAPAAGFYVNPIRSTANGRPLMYDTTTKELFSSNVLEFIGSTISTSDSSGLTVDVQTTFNSDVTIDNELTVTGNLIVNGITTTINSVTLTVDDKNIELGAIASPTDVTADGGGITLKGTTDKTFNYVNSTGLWTANIGIEAASFTGLAAAATTASTAASVGYMGIPQSATTTTLVIGDAGKHIYVNTSGQTLTIPAATSVAYPIGTTITFIAGPSASTVTIAITTDTMYLTGTGTTGSRTLAAHGMATAVKVSGTSSSGVWYINGSGLT
jgi:hypothetical protein